MGMPSCAHRQAFARHCAIEFPLGRARREKSMRDVQQNHRHRGKDWMRKARRADADRGLILEGTRRTTGLGLGAAGISPSCSYMMHALATETLPEAKGVRMTSDA